MSGRKKKSQESLAKQEAAKPVVAALPATSSLATTCAWGYFALLIVGFALYFYGGNLTVIAGQEMSFPKAIFTSINFGTLTGFPTTTNYTTDLKWQGQVLALVLTLGGILYSLIVGGTAAIRILKLPYTDRQVGMFSVVVTLIAVVCGAVPLIRGDQSLLAAAFQSASAFGNGGAWIGIEPTLSDWRTWLVLLPLALVGGLGLPVLIELLRPQREHRLSHHSQMTLVLSAGTIVLGAAILLALGWPTKTGNFEAIRVPFLQAVSGTVETRSAGLPLYYVTPEFSRAAHRILMLLMLIGAGTAGTAGGLKVTTLLSVYRGTRGVLAGRPVTRGFGIALTWVGILIGVMVLCHVNLLRQVPDLDADRLLMLAVSAATNCGLAHDKVTLSPAGYNSLSIAMLLGRIVPPMILWWLAQTTADEDLCAG